MYSFSGRVRYSEVNSEKQMKLPVLLDYLQDCCTMQSEDLGVGVDYLKERSQAWVLSSWEIKIARYPELGEEIKVSTWPYSFKGLYGNRNFTIESAAGEQLVIANSVWVYMDMEAMRPMRVTEEMLQAYQKDFGEELAGEWSPRKIKRDGLGEAREKFTVQRFHIDTNHHMNNSKYILAAEEELPEEFQTKTLRVEYKKAAMLHDTIFPYVTMEDEKAIVVLADEAENPYAILEFKK